MSSIDLNSREMEINTTDNSSTSRGLCSNMRTNKQVNEQNLQIVIIARKGASRKKLQRITGNLLAFSFHSTAYDPVPHIECALF